MASSYGFKIESQLLDKNRIKYFVFEKKANPSSKNFVTSQKISNLVKQSKKKLL